jgi:hypothetical protein
VPRRYTTHAIGGLSENDFICAAKIEALLALPLSTSQPPAPSSPPSAGTTRSNWPTASSPLCYTRGKKSHVACGDRSRGQLPTARASSADAARRTLLYRSDAYREKLFAANATQCPPRRKLLAPYIALGCRVVELSAKFDPSPLLPLLAGHSSVLVGQSGMGKSTLTNALVPGAAAPTRELSTALDSGKHTTTYARLYKLTR